MKYILYRTVCLVNQKFYIGKHQTENLDDGYLGSGIRLQRAIEKYGRDSFVREILGIYSSAEELNAAEKAAVTEEVLMDPNCYNLATGGQGGFLGESVRQKMKDSWTEERKENFSLAAKKRWRKNRKIYEKALKERGGSWNKLSDEQKQTQGNLMSNTIKNLWKNPKHRQKMKRVRAKTKATNAFIFATKNRKWMLSPSGERQLIKPEETQHYLANGWIFGMGKKNKTPH